MTILYEYCNTGDTKNCLVYAQYWKAETFTVGAAHAIVSVKLKLTKTGSPSGTITCGIRATNGTIPTGAHLTSGTISATSVTSGWYEISLTQYNLSASTKYAIVLSLSGGDSGNLINWRADGNLYANGAMCYSTNSGSSWAEDSSTDNMFEVYGPDLIVIPTVTTQAATGIGLD
jgi:hypothetical protein